MGRSARSAAEMGNGGYLPALLLALVASFPVMVGVLSMFLSTTLVKAGLITFLHSIAMMSFVGGAVLIGMMLNVSA